MCNLKCTSFQLAIVLSSIKSNRKLKKFHIEKIECHNNAIYNYVLSFLKANKIVRSLQFSWTNFFPKQLAELMKEISRKK